MYKLDFLSKAPNNFIFEKESNKTNLGGVITLIYLIIIIIITIVYICDYSINDKYSVLYNSENIFKSANESKQARYNDEKLNPKITFNIGTVFEHLVPEHYAIVTTIPGQENAKILKLGENCTVNILDISIGFYYKCKGVDMNGNCILHDEEKNQDQNIYSFIFNYTGSKINHQNENPLTTHFIHDNILFNIDENIFYRLLRWKTIIYTEKKGIYRFFDYLLGKSNEIYGGIFYNPLSLLVKRPESSKDLVKLGYLYLGHLAVRANDNNNYFDYYSRTKKTIFDPISSICSLCLTIYNIIIF